MRGTGTFRGETAFLWIANGYYGRFRSGHSDGHLRWLVEPHLPASHALREEVGMGKRLVVFHNPVYDGVPLDRGICDRSPPAGHLPRHFFDLVPGMLAGGIWGVAQVMYSLGWVSWGSRSVAR